jgi:hypothetical protein
MQANETPRQITTGNYLTILSRFPTDKELSTAEAYLQRNGTAKREAAMDLAWALINSPEFLYRH